MRICINCGEYHFLNPLNEEPCKYELELLVNKNLAIDEQYYECFTGKIEYCSFKAFVVKMSFELIDKKILWDKVSNNNNDESYIIQMWKYGKRYIYRLENRWKNC